MILLSCLWMALTFSQSHADARDKKIQACQARLTDASNPRAEALRELHRILPKLLGSEVKETPWFKLFSDFVIPNLERSDLIVNAIIGGGSTGKTTLFNASVFHFNNCEGGVGNGETCATQSRTDYAGGTTKQMTALIGEVWDGSNWITPFADELLRRSPDLRRGSADLAHQPGPGILIGARRFGRGNLVIIDTPGSDVNQIDRDTAEAAVKVAEVFTIKVSGSTIKNEYSRDILRELFERYGVRPIIFVAAQAYKKEIPSIRAALVEMAHSIYGTTGLDFPPGVLGAYAEKAADFEAAEAAHPELVPLEKVPGKAFPSYGELLGQMEADPQGSKAFALEKATEIIVTEATLALRNAHVKNLSTQVYAEAIRNAVTFAKQKARVEVQAQAYFDAVLEALKKYDDGAAGLSEYMFDWVVGKLTSLDPLFKIIEKIGTGLAGAPSDAVVQIKNYTAEFEQSIDALVRPAQFGVAGAAPEVDALADGLLVSKVQRYQTLMQEHARAKRDHDLAKGRITRQEYDALAATEEPELDSSEKGLIQFKLPEPSTLPTAVTKSLCDLAESRGKLAVEFDQRIKAKFDGMVDSELNAAEILERRSVGATVAQRLGKLCGVAASGVAACSFPKTWWIGSSWVRSIGASAATALPIAAWSKRSMKHHRLMRSQAKVDSYMTKASDTFIDRAIAKTAKVLEAHARPMQEFAEAQKHLQTLVPELAPWPVEL